MHLKADVWFPEAEEDKISNVLKELQGGTLIKDKGGVQTNSTPPTYTKVNEYTEVFQKLVNEYGIPKYQEANPALLTVVTFPFIFGMMYGDVGHGSMLLCAGIWLCLNAEKHRYTAVPLFTARYMVL